MLIGVLSDIHDDLTNLRRALGIYEKRGISTLIFCGDFCSPIPLRELTAFKGDIHCVFGNGDGDRFAMSNIAAANPHVTLYGEHAELEIDGTRIAVTHYPLYAQALARTGDYQAVFSGHTHKRHEERFGDCLWVNPGGLMEWQGPGTCVVYDTSLNQVEFIELVEV